MESSSFSLRFFQLQMARPLTSTVSLSANLNYCSWKQKRLSWQASAISYQKFIHFALNETKRHTHLETSPLQESYSSMVSMDGTVELKMLSFQAPKIRLMLSLSIESETMQVLDFGAFPKPEYDLPIFCANFFSNANANIILLFCPGEESLQAWLELMDEASAENNESRIVRSHEAQHRYLAWRAEKDPGHGVLKKLVGDKATKDLLRNFLFYGINELGCKSFLDYFPEYCSEDGTVIEKHSIIGKSFENRPWDGRGEFIGNNSTI